VKIANPNQTNTTAAAEKTGVRRIDIPARTQEASSSKPSGASVGIEGAGKASISDKAREMVKAQELAASAPDERAEKIAELKRRIQAKEYNVKPDDIADKMVKEHLETRTLG
jgi:flagellar biosynthesis anti-sigma factor FlgM